MVIVMMADVELLLWNVPKHACGSTRKEEFNNLQALWKVSWVQWNHNNMRPHLHEYSMTPWLKNCLLLLHHVRAIGLLSLKHWSIVSQFLEHQQSRITISKNDNKHRLHSNDSILLSCHHYLLCMCCGQHKEILWYYNTSIAQLYI